MKIEGTIIVGQHESVSTYNWVDPVTGTNKPLVSYRVMVKHADGTISKESISIPSQQRPADLIPGQVYGYPVSVRLNKKRMIINWDARPDAPPFALSKLQSDFGLES